MDNEVGLPGGGAGPSMPGGGLGGEITPAGGLAEVSSIPDVGEVVAPVAVTEAAGTAPAELAQKKHLP